MDSEALLQSALASERVISDMKNRTAIISVKDLNAEAIPVLKEAFNAVPGVQSIDFSLERSVAVVEFNGGEAKVDDLLRAVQQAGYQVI